jgi:hypothetical protein
VRLYLNMQLRWKAQKAQKPCHQVNQINYGPNYL